jgi:hypothetical protein
MTLHILAFSLNVLHTSSLLILFLLAFLALMVTFAAILYSNIVYGQNTSSGNNGTQIWTDKLNNIKLQFTNSPEKPIVDQPTDLKFSVQNLQTGTNLKNILARIIVLTNNSGQVRSFKFTNITAPNGIFSVKYLFPDSGIYQVITKIDSEDSSRIALASFKVLVPFQPLGSINMSNMNSLILPAILAGLIGTIAIIYFEIMIRRRRK